MTDQVWIENALTTSRPQAVAALLRYFRDLDAAEEAYQEACLRALRNWTINGPPRDPTAWLIMVGRNAALDAVRKRSKQAPMPDEAQVSDLEDVETPMVERLDHSQYRDDVLRLMFICCHPDLPAAQQVASRKNKTIFVAFQLSGQPVCMGLCADKNERRFGWKWFGRALQAPVQWIS